MLALVLALGSCSGEPASHRAAAAQGGTEPARTEPVVVRGTTLDALSGEPLAGVEVTLPNGERASSDAAGRFEFAGLPEGLSGPLRALAADGATAENPLRPLVPGVLEVVLRLRRP
jgi:hypothetical protein